MAWIAGLLALSAAAASTYNTNRRAKKQDQAIAEGIRQKSRVQRQADAKIGEELSQLERSTSAPEQASTMAQYQNAIRGTEQQARAGQALAGLSREYDAASGAAQGRTNNYLNQVIDSLSRIDAPGLQRQREGLRFADLGTDLRVLGREAEGIDYLANMRARGVRRNPYIDALAAGLNAYSGGYGNAGGYSQETVNSAGGYASGLGGGLYSGLGG